jgi:hypothetical protein
MSIIQPGSGYGFTSGGYGFTLNTQNPFPDEGDADYKPLYPTLSEGNVSVTPGTVNRYIPMIGTNHIDAIPAPTISVEGPGYVCVKATYEANKFFPRTATIVYHNGSTPPEDTNTESFYPLARVELVTAVTPSVLVMNLLVEPANLSVNRLKAGANNATWWWTRL